MSAARAEARAAPVASRVAPMGVLARFRAWREQHAWSLVSSLGRFFQRPFATFLTVGVMAVAIALPLALGLALANLQRLSGSLQASREIGVFLRVDADATQAERLATELRARRDVAAVELRTPAQGLAEFRQLSGLGEAAALLEDNPLPTVLRVTPLAGDGARLAEQLKARPEVELVQYDAGWRRRLAAWLDFGRTLALVLGSVLGLGVLLVVGNTVRLDIGNRRDEIAVLQQLGATDGFIRRPFIYLGAWYGLASGAAALGLLALAAALLRPSLAVLAGSYGSAFALRGPEPAAAAVLLLATTFVGWLGAWLASGHHLRQTRPTDL
jgi:cell division transport system permease protein